MANQNAVSKGKAAVDELRKTYAKALTDANKVISKNLDKMADQQLKDIKKTYEDAIKGLQSATKKGNVRDIAQAQAKVLQSSVDRVVKSARDSVKLISDTGRELSKILQTTNTTATKKAKATTSSAAKKATSAAKKTTASRKGPLNSGRPARMACAPLQ